MFSTQTKVQSSRARCQKWNEPESPNGPKPSFQLRKGWCHATGAEQKAASDCPELRAGSPSTCVRCYRQNLSCQTGGARSQKRVARVPYETEPVEDSVSDEGSDGSRRGWLAKFSTLNVGPPKGTKLVMG